MRIRNHPTTTKNDNGESFIPKSAGNEFFSPSCFSYTNEPENKAEIRFEKETRNSILFFHVFSSFENLKKKLFQPKVHEIVVDDWQRSNSRAFLINFFIFNFIFKLIYFINIGWEGESRQLTASPIRIASLLPSRSAMHGPVPLRVN